MLSVIDLPFVFHAVLAVAANEEYVPPTDWRAQIALPAAILLFLGSVFLLLRSNLGTRRAYLVEASSFFGFMVIMSLFWSFGAPGTNPYLGPQNLPGQSADHYVAKWVPFAGDSLVADMEPYAVVKSYPEGFGPVPDALSNAQEGVDEIKTFFASDTAGGVVGEDWRAVETAYAEAANGNPIIAAAFVPVNEEGQPQPDAEPYVAFGFFEAGFPAFPSYVFLVLSVAGFALHCALLVWDENREREDRLADPAAEPERVPARA